VRRDDALVPIRPGKQRAVLAALLLNANRAVSMEELAEALWGSSPPPSARALRDWQTVTERIHLLLTRRADEILKSEQSLDCPEESFRPRALALVPVVDFGGLRNLRMAA
jgi:DNA-binding SARP family transcriptional activator